MPERTRTRSAGGSKSPRASRSGGSRRSSGSRSAKSDSAGKGPKKVSNVAPLTPTLDPPDIESFAEFDLGAEISQAILDMGITKPTPIQALAIEPVLKGKDVIAKAETGTGKTLAFGAPMMAKIDPARASVLGLVMSPTRELAEQVHKVLEKLGEARGIKTALIVGGEPLGPQVRALQAGAQVVVGTPGRVLDLLNQKFLQFPWTEFAILDEADKMLEIGFIDDIKKILDACNEYRQTLLFSATFPTPLLELARSYTNDPVEIATASGVATVDTINQYVFRCAQEDYAKNLAYLIEDSAPEDVFLVFCERRTDVDMLMRKLERKRFSVKALHGGYDQAARFRVMTAFRTGDVKCLIATDVASRGLDVAHVTHVVNLGLPREFSDYTHRIGRTGRAGRHGAAVTFISSRNERDFQGLLKHTGFDIEELERPRDLFSQERKAKKVRDGEVIDVEGGETQREERSERKPRRERGERSERKPREERGQRAEGPDPAGQPDPTGQPDRTERPSRSERKPRAHRDEHEERPERAERRPRRAKSAERAEAPEREVEVDVPAEVAPEERPRRKRSPRRPRSTETVSEEAESQGTPSETEDPESRPRRPRRRRTRSSSDEPAIVAPSRAEAPSRKSRTAEAAEEEEPRRSSRRSREESEETPERSRGGRRPRRSRAEASADEAVSEPVEERPRRAPRVRAEASRSQPAPESAERSESAESPETVEDTAQRRPRRSRRAASDRTERTDKGSARDSERESTGKERTERPKRAPRSETVREVKETPRPARPTRQGGFGAGV